MLLSHSSRRSLVLGALIVSLSGGAGCGLVDDLRDQLVPDASQPAGQADLAGPPQPPDPEQSDVTNPDDSAPPPPGPSETNGLSFIGIEPARSEPAGGIDVLIRGTGFRDGLYVLFDQAVADDVFVVDTRTAIVRVPAHPPGQVDVTVGHPDLNRGEPIVLPRSFSYAATRSVTSIDPDEIPLFGGVPVTIEGFGFDADTRIAFGSRLAINLRVVDDRTIVAIAPGGDFGWSSIHLAHPDGFATTERAVFHHEPPHIDATDPLWLDDAAANAPITVHGRGFVADASVNLGGTNATVLSASPDGRRLTFAAPSFATVPTASLDLTIQTRWGSSRIEHALQPTAPTSNCSLIRPTRASTAGGEHLVIGCNTARFDPRNPTSLVALVGPRPALIVDQSDTAVVIRNPGGPAGPARVNLLTTAGTVADIPFELQAPPSGIEIHTVTPTRGPPSGGQAIEIKGADFTSGTAVQIGALAAPMVEVLSSSTIRATAPPGSPGPADVTVIRNGQPTVLRAGYEYASDSLDIFAIDPPVVAQPGGTRVAIHGIGFTNATSVVIGGVPCPIIDRPSGATLVIRSPRLDPGAHDLVARNDPNATITRHSALTVFDPRSGFGGTWGGPIAGTLNVTVYGSNGFGPIQGAHVIVGNDATTPWQGFTDDRGQISISEPRLAGPIDVTASAAGFSASSIVDFDARNATITLQMNPIPPPPSEGEGGGDPPPAPLPNATISGRVIGLDKYVLAPPGSCNALMSEDLADCQPCEVSSADACASAEHACVSVGQDGLRCLRACETDATCPAGFRCGATTDGARCIPSPGTRAAYCNVTSTSVFGYNYPVQATAWADADGRYAMGSQRLGDMAVYCLGGYRQDNGTFVPTVLGIKRNVFAAPGATVSNIDVELKHPLKRTFRVRLAAPPVAPNGLTPPVISLSLYLGADGAIGFGRDPIAGTSFEPDTWLLPRQLGALTGELYDASYVFYTTLTPVGAAGGQPRSFNLVQNVRRIVEDRLPVRDEGGWRLEGTQLERSLYGLWRGSDDRLIAVGEAGTILLHTGAGWTRQPTPTDATLRAIDGLHDNDVWAVGDNGVVVRRDGLRWMAVAGPDEDLGAVAVTADHVLAAGRVRLRVLDRTTGVWTAAMGPGVTGLRGLLRIDDTRVLAFGDAGQVWMWSATGANWLGNAGSARLRAGVLVASNPEGFRAVLVGDSGTLVEVTSDGGTFDTQFIATPTISSLGTVTRTLSGEIVAAGDDGVVVAWQPGLAARIEPIEDYRSAAHGIAALSDGTVRIVGNAAFILGPFLAFPHMTDPAPNSVFSPDRTLGWAWDGGPAAQYTRLALTPDYQLTAWTLIVDGDEKRVTLPDLLAAADISALPDARYRFEILRVLNRSFNIDNYTNRGFNLYLRDSWSTGQGFFTIATP